MTVTIISAGVADKSPEAAVIQIIIKINNRSIKGEEMTNIKTNLTNILKTSLIIKISSPRIITLIIPCIRVMIPAISLNINYREMK
jgi:hypothetical protein